MSTDMSSSISRFISGNISNSSVPIDGRRAEELEPDERLPRSESDCDKRESDVVDEKRSLTLAAQYVVHVSLFGAYKGTNEILCLQCACVRRCELVCSNRLYLPLVLRTEVSPAIVELTVVLTALAAAASASTLIIITSFFSWRNIITNVMPRYNGLQWVSSHVYQVGLLVNHRSSIPQNSPSLHGQCLRPKDGRRC